jgi:hypothetical protein
MYSLKVCTYRLAQSRGSVGAGQRMDTLTMSVSSSTLIMRISSRKRVKLSPRSGVNPSFQRPASSDQCSG